jgi:hypothetical protein
MFVSWRSLCVITVVVAAACDGSSPNIDVDDNDDDNVATVLNADRYCEELAPIFCPFYLRCGRMAVDDDSACRAAFAESCEPAFEARFVPLADAGLLQLSRAGLDACAAHLESASCDEQTLELSGPCAAIWEGTVPAGGACGLDAESFVCAPGTACTLDLSFCGVCESVVDVGGACRVDGATCGAAGECSDDDVCVDRPNTGEACSPDGPSCELPSRCADDNVCREFTVVDVGDACDRDFRCPYRSACLDAVCVATVGVGDACAVDVDCDAGFCAGGVCVALKDGDAGCASDAECGSGVCSDDATCASFAPRCTAP